MGEPKRTRLVFMGFSEEMIARTVLEELKAGIKNGDVSVEDWALLHKGPDGRVTILKDDEIKAVSRLMTAGGTGLMIAVPLAEAGRFDAFVEDCVTFEAAINRYQVDIEPGRTFEQAMEEYRAAISAG